MELSFTRSPSEQLALLACCAPEFSEAAREESGKDLISRGADPNANFPGYNTHMLVFVIHEGEAEGVDLLYKLGSRLPAGTTKEQADDLLGELQKRLVGRPASMLAALKVDLSALGGVEPCSLTSVPDSQEGKLGRLVGQNRVQQLEQALAALLEAHAAGSIEGEDDLFTQARSVFEQDGRMTFSTWLSRVCSEMAVDEVDGDSFRGYFDQGLSPSEAVLVDRMAADVIES